MWYCSIALTINILNLNGHNRDLAIEILQKLTQHWSVLTCVACLQYLNNYMDLTNPV